MRRRSQLLPMAPPSCLPKNQSFEAIPADCYDIQFQGTNTTWQPYRPGAEQGIDTPLLVKAKGRR